MSDSDTDYDAYYHPLDPEQLAAIDAATAHALSYQDPAAADDVPVLESGHVPVAAPAPAPHSPPSPDEFDAYDLSEFTAEDFAHIDALVAATTSTTPIVHTPTPPLPEEVLTPEPAAVCAVRSEPEGSESSRGAPGSPRGRGRGRGHGGGPQIQIAVERTVRADASRSLKDRRGKYPQPKRSPYEQFRSWNRLLSVTDLVGPSWCEVQFDYGLRQKRHKKLADRPDSFVTSEGKVIRISKHAAATNDRIVTRGRSVHKVLEREIQPEPDQVSITLAEERWALRIINMLNALQTLVEVGRCREMPVFGIVHDQVVTGIIDEIVRTPAPTEEPVVGPEPSSSKSSPNKRTAPNTTSSTPSSSKKSRREPDVDQPHITMFFSPTARTDVDSDIHEDPHPPLTSPDEDTYASRLQLMLYHRLLSNVLSTASASIPSADPLDFALLWERADVDPSKRFSDTFLHQAGLASATEHDPSLPEMSCLHDLTAAWRRAVFPLNVAEVDRTLTLVYRRQPSRRQPRREKKKKKEEERGKERAATLTLEEQEARDLAAAIQASISDVQPGSGGDDDLARAIFESLRESVRESRVADGDGDGDLGVLAHPFGPPIDHLAAGAGDGAGAGEYRGVGILGDGDAALSADPQIAWALQQSRLEETPALKKKAIEGDATAEDPAAEGTVSADAGTSTEHSAAQPKDETSIPASERTNPEDAAAATSPAPAGDESTDEELTAAELETEAKVLGTKGFALDDALLDDYLTRVLAWWYGERPPVGVDVELTRRCGCFTIRRTCEYRDGCEWRENKAEEALQRYRERSASGGDSTSLTGSVDAWI
ncbi:exonuclease V [Fomes fomentarius]|nr:exonuclease V [Fomes fomentarius]